MHFLPNLGDQLLFRITVLDLYFHSGTMHPISNWRRRRSFNQLKTFKTRNQTNETPTNEISQVSERLVGLHRRAVVPGRRWRFTRRTRLQGLAD
jgi:hypothetical protein